MFIRTQKAGAKCENIIVTILLEIRFISIILGISLQKCLSISLVIMVLLQPVHYNNLVRSNRVKQIRDVTIGELDMSDNRLTGVSDP